MQERDRRVSRRGMLWGASVVAACAASPARALLATTSAPPLPAAVEALVARMTPEEKAGQLTLMAAAWAGGAATALNPAGAASSFDAQLRDVRRGRLTEAVAATGTPLVVLLRTGRALALEGAVRDAPAVLVTWFLGSQDGAAIADVLFGAVSPSARLPVSFPHATGQSPYYYAHRPTGRPNPPGALQPYKAHFRAFANDALVPFGHGLTYGTIAYSGLALDTATLRATVANSSRRAATEVVQLYVHDEAASIPRPVRELKAFRRVALAPGARATVTFTLRHAELEFLGGDLTPVVEPGRFRVWIAPSAQAEGVTGVFTVA